MTPPKSHCMFCNSTSYGFGCAYSPHKRHVHISNGQKCIYCGSVAVGMGCSMNPFSKMHIRGVEYNMMTKESAYQSVMSGLFLTRLTQPITDTPAYKLGLIDESGRKMKECTTDEEKAALTPLDMHIFKIRRLIGEHVVELFKSNVLLEMASIKREEKFDANKYQQEVKMVSTIDHIIDDLKVVFDEGVETGFSRDHIENLVIESILRKYEDSKD